MSPTDEDLWDDQQTAQFLKLSPLTLRKARMVGSNGPPFVKLGHAVPAAHPARLRCQWIFNCQDSRHRRPAVFLQVTIPDRRSWPPDADVQELGLESEPVRFGTVSPYKVRERLKTNGATADEIAFLMEGQRVELNAMTSDQFVALVERKLTEAGIAKIVLPND